MVEFAGRHCCSATMLALCGALWARCVGLDRPPTALLTVFSTGVLWVSTGTHQCAAESWVTRTAERFGSSVISHEISVLFDKG